MVADWVPFNGWHMSSVLALTAHTHTNTIPLRLLFNLLPKPSLQKSKSLFLPTASQCEKHPSGIAQQHTKESLRAAIVALWLFRCDSCGDNKKDAHRRSSPRKGLKGKLSKKWGEKKEEEALLVSADCVLARFHFQSSLCQSDYTDEPCGLLWQRSIPFKAKQQQTAQQVLIKATPVLEWSEITADGGCQWRGVELCDLVDLSIHRTPE